MKKINSIFFAFLLFSSPAYAVDFSASSHINLETNQSQSIFPLTIRAEVENEITPEHGINILLDPTEWILWDETEIQVEGTAVDMGRVASDAQAIYEPSYKRLHIPVQEAFLPNEKLTISALKVRTYDDDFDRKFFGLDYTGDFVADVFEQNGYKINEEDEGSDNTIPYPPYDLAYEINDMGQIVLNWQRPADYDIQYMRVDKWETTEGEERYRPRIFDDNETTFTDENIASSVESVRYRLTAIDLTSRTSDPIEIVVDLVQDQPQLEEETLSDSDEVEESSSLDEEEMAEEVMDSATADADADVADMVLPFYNYYKLRYSIKCKPAGKIVPENDSACLWAKIDLVYTQEVTGEVDIDLELSSRDLELMATRRKWSQKRYEDQCVNASDPANYCNSLGKALDRVSYFLD